MVNELLGIAVVSTCDWVGPPRDIYKQTFIGDSPK